MAELRPRPPGTLTWVDLATPDVAAAQAFYGALFGWEVAALGPEAHGYAMFTRHETPVAGLSPLMAPGAPTAWTVHFAVDDAPASAARVRAAGGALIAEPMDVLDAGRLAVAADPTGAVFALWEAWRHPGAEVTGAPGTACWVELDTRDAKAAGAFYSAVFGWQAAPAEMAGSSGYTEWKLDGESVAGMMDMPATVPAEVPSHWLVYFATEDCDALVRRATDLGASVLLSATDIPPGRFAVLADPAGARFAVLALTAPPA